MPTQNQPAKKPDQTKNNASKYGPLLAIAILIACAVGYRIYMDKEPETETLEIKVEVSKDANELQIPAGIFRVKSLDLAHLKVPRSTSFRAYYYLTDTINDREVSLELIGESSCILNVPEGDVNYSLVRYGLALADGLYYSKAESLAKKEKLGIWSTQSEGL